MDYLKMQFDEVEKAMFEMVLSLWTHFGLLTIPNCGLGDFEKAMFHGLNGIFILLLAFGLAENSIS